MSHDRLAPIHSIVRSSLKDRSKCLETLLVHGEVDVNCPDAHNMTALHFAAMVSNTKRLYAYNTCTCSSVYSTV